MKLKIFTLLASSLLTVTNTFACSEEWRVPNCYMFCTSNRNEQSDYTKLNVKFWVNYTGKKFTEEQVASQLNTTDANDDNANAVLNFLKSKGDKNGTEYLEKLREMKKIAAVNENSWNYPSKAQLAQNKKDWEGIYNFAMTKVKDKKRNNLTNRYVLMAMRGAFYAGKDEAVNEIWLANAKQVRERDLSNQCQGYLANIWIKGGWTEKARDFYIKSGALNDLRASFPQAITVKTLKEVFDKYPESASFPYLVQYYINSIESDLHPQNAEATAKSDSLTKQELVRFVKFANGVVSAHTQQDALWQSAKGYAIYLLGDRKLALTELFKAQKMKSTGRINFNIRCCILLCKAETEEMGPKFESTLGRELVWLRNVAAKNKPYYDYASYRFRNHYTDVMDHLVHDILVPRYLAQHNVTTAAVLTNMANELNETQCVTNQRCTLVKRDSTKKGFNSDYSNDIFTMLDTAKIEDVMNYYTIMTQSGGTEFEQALVPYCYSDGNYICDIIATKLMREFKFKQAMEYLKKVDSKFAADMNIIPYLPYDYTTEFWLKWHKQAANPKLQKKAYSQKMNFCKDMLKLEDAVAKAQQKKKMDAKYAANAYQLAMGYIQASPMGACWALTNYSWSSAQDSVKLADNAYLKRAQTLLRSAYSADMSEENMVRCLSGMFFISHYTPIDDQEKLAKLLWRLSETPSGSARNVSNCDVLRNYILSVN